MSRVCKSREQTYLRFDKITDTDGPCFETIKSKGVALSDGVWALVRGGVAMLLRVSTVTRNGHNMDVGFAVASGESAWVARQLHLCFHKLAVFLFGIDNSIPYLKWHMMDDGPGITKGVYQFLSDPMFAGIVLCGLSYF